MQPFKLRPAMKDYLWGGTRLRDEYGKKTDLDPVAESWELSAHPDGPSIIEGGEMDGMSFRDFVQKHPGAMGTHNALEAEFPILIKYIDAAKSLSVQVHPDEEYAQRVEHEHGKTEMWVVLDAQPGAYIYYGFKKPVTREEMAQSIADGTLTELLEKVPCKPGDVFFIPAGTLHAIGAGLLVAEIQQSSNSTYRVFDFGRLGPDGQPRALHVEKALDVTDTTPATTEVPGQGGITHTEDYNVDCLASCEYFTANRLRLENFYSFTVDDKSFVAVMCLDGGATLQGKENSLTLTKGETAFLPAGCGEIRIKGKADMILASC